MKKDDDRGARLANALRENLRKRKAQARAVASPDDDSATLSPSTPPRSHS
jgi:hypothetical protein